MNNGDEHEKMNRTEKGGEKYFENQYGKNENLIEFEVDEKLKKESEKRKIELEAEKVKENSHKAMLKVREILVRAHQKDEAMQRNGETSDSARKLMDQLYKAYPNHTAELENLNKEAIIEFEELQHLEDIRELVREIPIPEVFCEKCCVPLHEIVDSVVLRVLMADVYEYHFYPTRKVGLKNGNCSGKKLFQVFNNFKIEFFKLVKG